MNFLSRLGRIEKILDEHNPAEQFEIVFINHGEDEEETLKNADGKNKIIIVKFVKSEKSAPDPEPTLKAYK